MERERQKLDKEEIQKKLKEIAELLLTSFYRTNFVGSPGIFVHLDLLDGKMDYPRLIILYSILVSPYIFYELNKIIEDHPDSIVNKFTKAIGELGVLIPLLTGLTIKTVLDKNCEKQK